MSVAESPPPPPHAPVHPSDADAWPREVELILSALEAGQQHDNRRRHPRSRHRVRAQLRLFSDLAGDGPWTLYTRDVSARGVGFITPHRLPLGYGGTVELPGPDGQLVTANGTLFRCREVSPGWYEGAIYFNREQWMFSADEPAVTAAPRRGRS
jgi:hypothetical protein